MTRNFATITDLAAHLAETMDLDTDAVTDAVRANHHLFDSYGRIPAADLTALSAAVWFAVTGTDYPEAWAQQDAERADEEN